MIDTEMKIEDTPPEGTAEANAAVSGADEGVSPCGGSARETHPPGQYAFHPTAEIFPLLEGEDFEALVADVKTHGLQEAITLDATGRRIIDGRNRYRACMASGVEPRFRNLPRLPEKGSELDFVISANLHRRHLKESQRAMVAARIADLKPHEKKADRSIGPSARPAVSQEDAAKCLNVSVTSVKRAKVVKDRGTERLVAATERGIIPVSLAERMTELPPDQQDEVAAACLERGDARPARVAALDASRCAKNEKLDGPLQSAVVRADQPRRGKRGVAASHEIAEPYPMPPEQINALARELGKRLPPDCDLLVSTRAPLNHSAQDLIKEILAPGEGPRWTTWKNERLIMEVRRFGPSEPSLSAESLPGASPVPSAPTGSSPMPDATLVSSANASTPSKANEGDINLD